VSAKERIAGDILEGAEFLKRGTQVTSNDKVGSNYFGEALSQSNNRMGGK
jgi:hypothetical protein